MPAQCAGNCTETNGDRMAEIRVLQYTAIEDLRVGIEMNFRFSGLMQSIVSLNWRSPI
jgi:hypothetical protein